mgnify:CR=1 FL=1|jgi:hypothetical protein
MLLLLLYSYVVHLARPEALARRDGVVDCFAQPQAGVFVGVDACAVLPVLVDGASTGAVCQCADDAPETDFFSLSVLDVDFESFLSNVLDSFDDRSPTGFLRSR